MMDLNRIHCAVCRGSAGNGRLLVIHQGKAYCVPCFAGEYPELAEKLLVRLADFEMTKAGVK